MKYDITTAISIDPYYPSDPQFSLWLSLTQTDSKNFYMKR